MRDASTAARAFAAGCAVIIASSENERDDAAVARACESKVCTARAQRLSSWATGAGDGGASSAFSKKQKCVAVCCSLFSRGTQARIQFDELRHPVSLDEIFGVGCALAS